MLVEKSLDVMEAALTLAAIYLFVPSFVVKETWLHGFKPTLYRSCVKRVLRFLRLDINESGEGKQAYQATACDTRRYSFQLTFTAVALIFYWCKLMFELLKLKQLVQLDV